MPRRARSARRLRDALVSAVIGSGRAAAEAAASSLGASWWLVQRALDSAALTLPDVDALAPRCSALMNIATVPCEASPSAVDLLCEPLPDFGDRRSGLG